MKKLWSVAKRPEGLKIGSTAKYALVRHATTNRLSCHDITNHLQVPLSGKNQITLLFQLIQEAHRFKRSLQRQNLIALQLMGGTEDSGQGPFSLLNKAGSILNPHHPAFRKPFGRDSDQITVRL